MAQARYDALWERKAQLEKELADVKVELQLAREDFNNKARSVCIF